MNNLEPIVIRLQAGDKDAFCEFYSQTVNAAYRYAQNILKNPHDADDAIQVAYIKANKYLPTLRNTAVAKSWLLKIVHNSCMDVIQKNSKSGVVSEDEYSNVVEFSQDARPQPHEAVEVSEKNKQLMQFVGELNEDQRSAVIFHYIEALSIKEIASMQSCSENTVKTRLSYARNHLKKMISTARIQGTAMFGFGVAFSPIDSIRKIAQEKFISDAHATEIFSNIVSESELAGTVAAEAATAETSSVAIKVATATAQNTAVAVKIAASVLACVLLAGLIFWLNIPEEDIPVQAPLALQTETPTSTVAPTPTPNINASVAIAPPTHDVAPEPLLAEPEVSVPTPVLSKTEKPKPTPKPTSTQYIVVVTPDPTPDRIKVEAIGTIRLGSEVFTSYYLQIPTAVIQTWHFSVDVVPANATEKGVIWSSSNTSVATVSSSGVLTAHNEGQITLTAKAKDGGFQTSCSVTIAYSTYHPPASDTDVYPAPPAGEETTLP